MACCVSPPIHSLKRICHFNEISVTGTCTDYIGTSQITSLTIVNSTVYSDADQRKHRSSALLAFVRGIHRRPVNSPHKWPVTRKMFPFDDVIMKNHISFQCYPHGTDLNGIKMNTYSKIVLLSLKIPQYFVWFHRPYSKISYDKWVRVRNLEPSKKSLGSVWTTAIYPRYQRVKCRRVYVHHCGVMLMISGLVNLKGDSLKLNISLSYELKVWSRKIWECRVTYIYLHVRKCV